MTPNKTSPRDFFLYVGAMIALYWSAVSLIALSFTIVDTVYRDQLQYYFDPYSSGIRFAIASLIVVFPISVLLLRIIKNGVMHEPTKLLLPIRRWVFTFTVFLTSAALIADIIALLNTFLGGEITARFVLKVASVIVVSGIVFCYSFLEIRSKPEAPALVRREFLWGAPLLVLAAIISGFAVMGSPSTIRALRFDERRVQDLSSIQWQIVNYWQQKSKLPASLGELDDPIAGYKVPVDPRTSAQYEYDPNITSAKGELPAFALCATFERESPGTSASVPRAPYIVDRMNDNWEHEAGRECFDRSIDPELYPTKPDLQRGLRSL